MRYGTRSLFRKTRHDSREFKLTVRYKFNPASDKWRGSGAGNAEKARF
ncbi:MAG: hypothetical protein IJ808_06155 [Muribaculaceae bacterium]|nr:hypothetical protein [Muribaculaceae bacterium]